MIIKKLIICLYIFVFITIAGTQLVLHPADQWVPEGGRVTLSCIFNISAEDCFWELDKIQVHVKLFKDYELAEDDDKGNCSLTIKNANISRDEGSWRCYLGRTPDYPNGILSNIARLGVIVQPSLPYLIYNDKKIANDSVLKITNEEKISIICETKFGNPETNLFWKIGENTYLKGNIKFENEDKTLRLKRTTNTLNLFIKPNMNSQNITCYSHHFNVEERISFQLNVSCTVLSVTNGYSTPYPFVKQNATSNVKIVSAIHTAAVEGEIVHFMCVANGNPIPNFEWRFKPSTSKEWAATEHKSNFTLRATKSIAGQYLCIAGNNLGPVKWSLEVTLTVTDKISQLLYNLIIPLVVCLIVLFLISFALVVYLRYHQRKKKSNLDEKVVSTSNLDQYETNKTPDETEISSSIFHTHLDEDGYLKTRPLPSVYFSKDQYVDFDPELDKTVEDNRLSSSSRQSDESNSHYDKHVYETPHFYENPASVTED